MRKWMMMMMESDISENSGESETTENGTIHLSKVNKSTFLDVEERRERKREKREEEGEERTTHPLLLKFLRENVRR